MYNLEILEKGCEELGIKSPQHNIKARLFNVSCNFIFLYSFLSDIIP